jgi:hypothetical protein
MDKGEGHVKPIRDASVREREKGSAGHIQGGSTFSTSSFLRWIGVCVCGGGGGERERGGGWWVVVGGGGVIRL